MKYYNNQLDDDSRSYGVYWHNNDVLLCFLGGLLVGTVVASRMYIFGRVTGISGLIQGSFLHDLKSPFAFDIKRISSAAVVVGIILGGVICKYVFDNGCFQDWTDAGWPRIIAAGLLVGFGTKKGNGCTSGHGVCGISSMRIRSLVATCCFMLAGIVTAMATNTYALLPQFQNTLQVEKACLVWGITTFVVLVTVAIAHFLHAHDKNYCKSFSWSHMTIITVMEVIFGMAFGIAMSISNMSLLSATISFLDLRYWNPALAFVMIGAIVTTAASFYYIFGLSMPLFDVKFYRPMLTDIDVPLVSGAIIFGVGWGLLGACPGPAITNIGTGYAAPIVYSIVIVIGMWIEFFTANLFATKRTSDVDKSPGTVVVGLGSSSESEKFNNLLQTAGGGGERTSEEESGSNKI